MINNHKQTKKKKRQLLLIIAFSPFAQISRQTLRSKTVLRNLEGYYINVKTGIMKLSMKISSLETVKKIIMSLEQGLSLLRVSVYTLISIPGIHTSNHSFVEPCKNCSASRFISSIHFSTQTKRRWGYLNLETSKPYSIFSFSLLSPKTMFFLNISSVVKFMNPVLKISCFLVSFCSFQFYIYLFIYLLIAFFVELFKAFKNLSSQIRCSLFSPFFKLLSENLNFSYQSIIKQGWSNMFGLACLMLYSGLILGFGLGQE